MTTPIPNPAQRPRADATKDALIRAAVAVFGRDGFQAASTRAIAQEAGVNQALIKYHFANKQGLYDAAIQSIADRMGTEVLPIFHAIEANRVEDDPAASLFALKRMLGAMIGLLAREDAANWAQLIVREQQSPGPAFLKIYDGIMAPALTTMARLVNVLDPAGRLGDPKLLVITLVGQVLVLRVAHATMMRFVGWDRIGDKELEEIRARIGRNLDRLFAETEHAP
ncbi:CerR family C-terminal domain-containing protein [Rhodospirillaceae bacterium KN72]|uniref:CerR family C-terminal domain-containing protein n=1 Tax=Pacificispira spongiicola TaxID=2729598 RepID=A0A7Y0E1S2_9PROT|nr:CerR family C-terminal domain-containing protein [Pacificispira spongiicola]NMM45658.1 CerR family C-terminal domain-containing protein [Pacificispira spongiicola]